MYNFTRNMNETQAPRIAPASIAALISAFEHYTRQAGGKLSRNAKGWVNGLCPFHDDRQASFGISPSGVGHCFAGCGSYSPAALAERLGVTLVYEGGGKVGKRATNTPPAAPSKAAIAPKATPVLPPPAEYQNAARRLAEECHANLWRPVGEAALEYLHKRGLSDETIKAAGLGYNPTARPCPPILASNGKVAFLPTGITIPHQNCGVMWAIKVRRLDGKTPKYVQLPGLADKGSLYLADGVKVGKPVLICEGEFDALIVWQVARDLVAPVTRGGVDYLNDMPPGHAAALAAAPKVIALMDNDPAGRKAAALLVGRYPAAVIATLPEGVKDVSEYHNAGGDVRALILDALAAPASESMAASPAEAEGQPRRTATSNVEGDSLYANIFADRLKGEFTYDGQAWRRWEGTHWQALTNPRMVLDRLAEDAILAGGGKVTSGRIDSVLRLTAHAGRLGRAFTPRPDLVPFQNGTLEVETGHLRPHDKADNLTYCLPYPYEPSGKWDTIRRVLTENMPDPLAVAAYMGHIGLALLGAVKDGQGRRSKAFHKALVLIGTRGSGKSTLLDLANMVLGQPEGNHLPAKVFDTDNRAANLRAEYLDRPLATVDEFPDNALHDGSTEDQFKQMCAGGTVAAWYPFGRQKGTAIWRPKMILATNNPPMLTDHSRALERRLVFIECPNYRPDGKARNVLADCEAELPGFAAACIEMARRIQAAGVYPESDGMAALKGRIFTSGSNIKQFLAERCEVTGRSEDRVATSRLYAAYRAWVKAQGGHEMTHIRMTNAVEMAAGPKVRTGTFDNLPTLEFDESGLRTVYKRARAFAGLRLLDTEEFGEGEAARAEGQPDPAYWLSGLLDGGPENTPPASPPPSGSETPHQQPARAEGHQNATIAPVSPNGGVDTLRPPSAPSGPNSARSGGRVFSTAHLNAQAAAALAEQPDLDLGDCTVTDIDGITYPAPSAMPPAESGGEGEAGEASMTTARFVELVTTARYALRAAAALAELTGDKVHNGLEKDEFRLVWKACPPSERPALTRLAARVSHWYMWAGRLAREDQAVGG